MTPSRSLKLRRESLTELTADDLAAVAGGIPEEMSGLTCPVLDCLSGAVCQLTQQPRCF